MPKYLIEVPHEAEELACARVIQVFLSSGSHFLTHAEWGCGDGVHSAWIIVEAENRDRARGVVPPAFRAVARIVRVRHFSMADIEPILARHRATGSGEAGLG